MQTPTTTINPQDLSWTELKHLVFSLYDQIKETAAQLKETERMVKENSADTKKTKAALRKSSERVDKQLQETDLQIKETAAQMKETDRKLKELSTRFTTTIGNLTEGLLDPATLKLFQDAGFNVNRFFSNMRKKDKGADVEMEIDQFMVDGDTAIAVEIKTACSKRDIDRFFDKMMNFKALFPEYINKKIYLAIAAIKYEKGCDDYAHQQGLLVVRATPDNIFSLDSSKNDNLITL